ncbi:MAG: precorrin-6y C5,15-methyltransferase (decarboxylating) subunit CbiE [Mucilaginibacter sp.]|uniref:precorrin-6y C5,15-methyltransferase (decarboxylating) subunit CbiE n=1 Tax=Mucilaginibacter sp. TaxID=1882438 RepID=UPI0031A16D17
MIFQVIGIGNKKYEPAEQLLGLIQKHHIFSGGQRHYELVKHLLPAGHEWIFIKSRIDNLFEDYRNTNEGIVVFASGDPLFYGIANTLHTKYPDTQVQVYPYFNAIQLLAQRININSNQLQTVSVHGRTWDALDEIIIKQAPLIGVLTDAEKSPAAIADRLLHYGYDNYTIYIGENLEADDEQVSQMELTEACEHVYHPLNCVIVQKKAHRDISFGVPDDSFEGLEGRPNMITKMPVRLCSLHALALESKTTLWDIGFCTGSLSIEAKLRFPHLDIYAFEKRPECMQIIANNQRKFGALGIKTYQGDIFELDFTQYNKPDAIFIGGHGGRLNELIRKIDQHINPGAVVVMNAVQHDSVNEFISTIQTLNWTIHEPLKLKVNSHNEITILKAIKGN